MREIDRMTHPLTTLKRGGFLFTSEVPTYAGEQFYRVSPSLEMPASQKAFILRFPESGYRYEWEDAVKFSGSLKWRIHKIKHSDTERRRSSFASSLDAQFEAAKDRNIILNKRIKGIAPGSLPKGVRESRLQSITHLRTAPKISLNCGFELKLAALLYRY